MMTVSATISDQDLLVQFHAGDDRAFEILYERWSSRVLHYAARMLGDRAEAEEVVTDAFITLVRGQVRPTGSLRSYLFTVVHRRCIDRIRRRRTHDNVRHLLVEAPKTPDLDATIDSRRQVERMEAAMSSLPDEHRSVLMLYYGQGLRSGEVASVLELTDQQVRSKLSYARRALKAALETP